MADPFLSEIRMMSFNFPPRGWAFCNGQILPISQNQALFSLLGTTYGGNGQTTFALPNLQARVPVHEGAGLALGQSSGEANHTLTQSELPAHTHFVTATSTAATLPGPVAGAQLAQSSKANYSNVLSVPMASTVFSSVGGSQPHDNSQPYLVVNFCIALTGIFPSRN